MRIFPFLSLFLLHFFFLSCKEKEKQSLGLSPIPPINHPTFTYLTNENNWADSLYVQKAKTYMNHFLAKNQLDSATIVLYHAATNLFKNYKNDSTLTYTTIQFTNTYKQEISPYYWGFFHRFIASYFDSKNQADSSIFYLNRGLIQNNPANQVIFTNAKIHYDLIVNYLHSGDLGKALTSGQKSLDLYQSIDSTYYLGPVHSGIACVHLFENNYSNALFHEQLGYTLSVNAQDSAFIYTCSLNKINLYQSINHPNLVPFIDSTLVFAKKWVPKAKNPNITFEVEAWRAYKEAYLGNLQQSKEILDAIKPHVLSTDDRILTDYYANALSLYELKSGKGAEDPTFYKSQIKDLIEYEDYGRLQLFYEILADDAISQSNYKEAYTYTQLAETAKDSLSNLLVRDKLAQLDKSYQTKLKEKTITVQKAELLQKQSQIFILGIILLIVLLTATVYIFWQKQKSLQKERRDNLSFTKLLFRNVEDERKRIANDLHDSISHELLSLKNMQTDERAKYSVKIDSIIHEIRSISRNLHPVMFEKTGLIPNINQLVERIQTSHQFMVSTELDYANQLPVADELQIYRIIQESLSNCIKYAQAHAAKIVLKEEYNSVHLFILDNGKGFDVDLVLENSHSFGLHSIIERSRALGGMAQIKSSQKGTEIHVQIPLKKF